MGSTREINRLQQEMLDRWQRDLPVSPAPYADMADSLGTTEEEVMGALNELLSTGVCSRIGPVFAPRRLGASVLVAMEVPEARLEQVAHLVSSYAEVNHNYEREHRLNLWFVAAAADQEHIDSLLADIEHRTGITPLPLPLLEEFHIDLGFDLQWD